MLLPTTNKPHHHDHHHDHHDHCNHDHSEDVHRNKVSVNNYARFFRHITTDKDARKLTILLVINLIMAILEVIYGFLSNSIGLLSDSAHMLFDSTALAVGIYASYKATLPANSKFSYGFDRFQTLSGLINGIFLIFIGFYIFIESLERMYNPPEIHIQKMIVVAVIGLIVNVVGVTFFHEHAHFGDDHSGCSHGHSHGHEHSHDHKHHNHAKVKGEHSHSHHDHHSHDDSLSSINSTQNSIRDVDHHDHDHHHHDHAGHSHSHSHAHAHKHEHKHEKVSPRNQQIDNSQDESEDHAHHAHAKKQAHDHSHTHAHAHSHGHAHGHTHTQACSHSHDHSHNHSHSHSPKEAHNHAHGAAYSHSHSHSHDLEHHDHAHDHSHDHNENLYGVFLHILADLLGSVGVIASSILIYFFNLHVADAICSAITSLLILASVVPLIKSSIMVFMQTCPAKYTKPFHHAIQEISQHPDVIECRDLHLWSYTQSKLVCSVILVVRNNTSDTTQVVKFARKKLSAIKALEFMTIDCRLED